jgi:rRNA-processing protein EBP2
LLDERAGIQKSETAKKQRELKKIGKQVQVEKIKEREKGKKEMNERVKGLKRSEWGARCHCHKLTTTHRTWRSARCYAG